MPALLLGKKVAKRLREVLNLIVKRLSRKSVNTAQTQTETSQIHGAKTTLSARQFLNLGGLPSKLMAIHALIFDI